VGKALLANYLRLGNCRVLPLLHEYRRLGALQTVDFREHLFQLRVGQPGLIGNRSPLLLARPLPLPYTAVRSSVADEADIYRLVIPRDGIVGDLVGVQILQLFVNLAPTANFLDLVSGDAGDLEPFAHRLPVGVCDLTVLAGAAP